MASISGDTNDLRYAVRMLRKTPVFTITIIAVLGLGIGLNGAMFSVINTLLWHALPFPAADRLMSLEQRLPNGQIADAASYPDFLDWRQSSSFEALSGSSEQEVVLRGPYHPERAFSEFVTPGYFGLLGLHPRLGRTFSEAEARAEAPVAVISHEMWKSHFGSASDIIGRPVQVNDAALTIIGVLPQESTGLTRRTAIWIPINRIGMVSTPQLLENRAAFLVQVVGRLKPDVPVSRVKAEFQAISRQLQVSYPDTNQGREVVVQPLLETKAGPVRDAIMMLFGSVTLVLLIACFNVANLVFSRYVQRQREFAIRLALGASRSHIVRQVIVESLLISAMGALAGLLLTAACLHVIRTSQVAALDNSAPISFDWSTVAYSTAISVLGALLLGLAPAIRFCFTRTEGLKSGERAGSSRWSARVRDLLVFSQVFLATVLLIGCGLLFRSLAHLYSIDPGFRTQDVTAVDLGAMPPSRYAEPGQLTTYYWHLLQRLEQIPGIRSVGASMRLPLNGPTPSIPFIIKGRTNEGPAGQALTVGYTAVSPNYLPTIGVQVSGRDFTQRDVLESNPVVILNAAIARRYWPARSPIGDYLKTFDGESRWRLIVGVANDVRSASLTQSPEPAVYVPFAQIPPLFTSILRNFPMSFVLNSTQSAAQIAPTVRQAVSSVDSEQVILNIFPMRTLVTNSVRTPSLYTQLLGVFSFGALLLASTGIYGVVSYAVIQRTRELGVRLALGAAPSNILSVILGRGMAVVIPGAALGLIAGFLLTRVVASLLFGVSRADPITFATVGVSLIAVGLLASLLPALQAAYIDPKIALRQE